MKEASIICEKKNRNQREMKKKTELKSSGRKHIHNSRRENAGDKRTNDGKRKQTRKREDKRTYEGIWNKLENAILDDSKWKQKNHTRTDENYE